MYMDDLSIGLNNSGIGGHLEDAFLKHLCYAMIYVLLACPPVECNNNVKPGCILNARPVARGECISPRAGAKLSNTRPVGKWSKCCNTS